MDRGLPSKPNSVNNEPFSAEKFPEIIGFCDRDNTSYIRNNDEEAYVYKLGTEPIYTIKKKQNRWEVIEFTHGQLHRINAGTVLGQVLVQALSFSEKDKNNQEKRVNILFPVDPHDLEKALAIVYYLGGYPTGNSIGPAELAVIQEKFAEPNLEYLSYSYVPVPYLPWLREELKQADITGQTPKRTLWVYKK